MQPVVLVSLLALLAPARAAEESPITKVLDLISGLQSKIIAEGEAAQKLFEEFSEWCEDRSKNLAYEITTGKSEVASLTATIGEASATISELEAKVGQLTADIAKDEEDLAAASKIRAEEAADFAAEEKEMKDIISTLERAIGFVSKKMASASMMQLKDARNIADALSVMVQASVFSTADADRLTALVQSSQKSGDSEDEDASGAPEAAVYKDHSAGIVGTLEDLLDKAQAQLDDAVKKETASAYNFDMLKQSLENEIKFAKKELDDAQKGIAESTEKKAVAEGDLEATSKELKEDIATKEGLHAKCMSGSADFEAESKSRGEELAALAKAKEIITEATGASLTQVSFFQSSSLKLQSGMDLAHFEAVRFVRDLARKQKAPELAQLAKQMASAMRVGARAGQDPFGKVKGLISDLISKLEADAATDASHNAYCEKEMAESKTKQGEKTYEIEKLSTKISSMSARSAQLKEEVAALQKSLAELAAAQADMDKIRSAENELYVSSKAETEKGLEGTKLAIKVLKEYYDMSDKAHEAATGSASGIIGILEVIESDFSKGLAELIATEDSAAAAYKAETYMNEVDKTSKEQDVKYKTEESTSLDKAVAEATSDKSGVQAELDAVNEYMDKLVSMCVAKAEPYAERKSRREAELAGLKEALDILAGEAVLLQQNAKRTLRGVRAHTAA
jgi:septal ring factor EnvC (AmiA/AmiB activator)